MTPEVVDGYRGPRNEARAASAERVSGRFAAIPEGKTVFQFIANRYRLQLTAPRPQTLADGRILEGDKALVVVADDRVAVLDNVKDAKAIELIRAHKDYGVDFWDFSEVLERSKRQKIEQTVKALLDPETRDEVRRILAQSGDESFAVPKGGPKPSAPPAPASKAPAGA